MSVIFTRETGIRYFQIPQAAVTKNWLRDFSPSALRLYVALLFKAQHHSRPDLRLINDELSDFTGLSPNSIQAARRELLKLGAIRCDKGPGGVFTYHICDPNTGKALVRPSKAANDGSRTNAPNSNASAPESAGPRPTQKDTGINQALTFEEKRRYFELRLPGQRFQRISKGVLTLCPFHADTNPSLHITFEEGVWYCFGCRKGGGLIKFETLISGANGTAAVQAIGELLHRPDLKRSMPSKARSVYPYADANGRLVSQVLRFESEKRGGKTFTQRRPAPDGSGWIKDTDGVPDIFYRLPEVLVADTVIYCEGEKAADRLRDALGSRLPDICATTSRNGAGAWNDSIADALKPEQKFVVLPDNDTPGRDHAEAVAVSAYQRTRCVKIVPLPGVPEHGDVCEFLDKNSIEDLLTLIDGAGLYEVPF